MWKIVDRFLTVQGCHHNPGSSNFKLLASQIASAAPTPERNALQPARQRARLRAPPVRPRGRTVSVGRRRLNRGCSGSGGRWAVGGGRWEVGGGRWAVGGAAVAACSRVLENSEHHRGQAKPSGGGPCLMRPPKMGRILWSPSGKR